MKLPNTKFYSAYKYNIFKLIKNLSIKSLWYFTNIIISFIDNVGGIPISRNAKQSAIKKTILKIAKQKKFIICVETGRLRNPDWKNSDGDSTNFITKFRVVKKLYSIDNDSENYTGEISSETYCRKYLNKKQLTKIIFLNGDSRKVLKDIPANEKVDLLYLDSANDPLLINDEYELAKIYLNETSIIMVDDIAPPGRKGDYLLPKLVDEGFEIEIIQAPPGNSAIIFRK